MAEVNLPKRTPRQLGIRVSPELHEKLGRVADGLDSTPSDVVRECIRIALPELEARATLEPATYDRVFEVAQVLGKTPAELVEAWTKLALPEAETKMRRKQRAEARKDVS